MCRRTHIRWCADVSTCTYFPMLSGRTCNEISLIERHVRFRSSGKLSGSLGRETTGRRGEEFAQRNSFSHIPWHSMHAKWDYPRNRMSIYIRSGTQQCDKLAQWNWIQMFTCGYQSIKCNRQSNRLWTLKPAVHLVKGFPLKSATCRALQYEMLSGISIISARNTDTC